jgi:NAD(P)-dependent dehydrogenase (short-subunit alcohol dehydrogenase family)
VSLNPKIRDWRGQRVWVIGASTGIGAAVARDLINAGARVALSARSRGRLDAIAEGTDAIVTPLDITDRTAVLAAATQVRDALGALDLVIVVAGTHSAMRADRFDRAEADQLLAVNLVGPLNCLEAVLPTLLKQRRGGIALVASVAGYRGLPQALIYGPTKAALIHLAEGLYLDLRRHGIGVYLVNPGFVDTPLTQRNDFAMPALMTAEKAARRTLDGIAAGRFETHYPRRFTGWLKLLRILPYPAYFWAVRRFTGA